MTIPCPSAAELEKQLQGQFVGAAALEAHLSNCAECQRVLDHLTSPDQAGASTLCPDLTPEHEADWRAHQKGLERALLGQLHHVHARESTPRGLPVIPGYRIECQLGEGGAGIVYRARHEKLKRKVALKMIRPSILDRVAGLARFQREAAVLSRLHHPNVVQLFDFGEACETQGAPTPYMVLELVEGGTLGEKINNRPVPAHSAAALVEILARAVHAVHQQGIIHRDLKPGNVLLQPIAGSAGSVSLSDPGRLLEEYVPKITDFGVAKELTVEQARWTQTCDVVGTPAYMAPEQAGEGKEVTPAADIYALGVILYELLTGLPPFRARDWVELVVQIKEREPVTPSRLLPGIPRDLETICLKCLHKEPARRYSRAEALADDLRRFLDGKTILARPTGQAEKLWKWCRRNRWVAGLSAAVVTLLVVGLAVTTWLTLLANQSRVETQEALHLLQIEQGRTKGALDQLQQEQARTQMALAAERRRREQARQALEAITSEMVPDWLGRGTTLTAEQKQFLTRALTLYQDFARDTATDESSRVDVADAQLRVAQFQRSLTQRGEGRDNAEQAQQKWEQLVNEFPAKPEYGRRLALAHWTLSVLQRETGQVKAAEQSVRAALALNQRLLADFGADPVTENQLCDSLNTLGTILRGTGRLQQAEEQFRALVPARRKLLKRFPDKVDHGIGLIWAYLNLALVAMDRSRMEEADKRIQEALAVAVPLAAEHPSDLLCRRWLGRCREVRGDILVKMGQLAKAESEYRAAVTVMDGAYRDFPSRLDIQSLLLRNRTSLSSVLSRLGKFPDAEKELRPVLTILGPLADTPAFGPLRNELAGIMVSRARLCVQQNQREVARRCLEEAEPHHRAALAADSRNASYRAGYRDNRQILADCLIELGDYAAAARTVEQWTQCAVDAKNDSYHAATCLARCVAMAQKDETLTAAQRQQLTDKYGAGALKLLNHAIANGFQDVAALKKNPALETFRKQPGFQEAYTDMETRGRKQPQTPAKN